MRLVNIGCGDKFVKGPEWINIDINPADDSVIKCNILSGIPFQDSYFDYIYHSNVLEHLSKEEGIRFMRECHRILKPNGVIRVAVPDLESIVNEYIKQLDTARANIESGKVNYDWIIIELIDQMTRRTNGGLMQKYLLSKEIPNIEYVSKRIGNEVFKIRNSQKYFTSSRIKRFTILNIRRKMLNKINKILLGDKYIYLRYAEFLMQGEVHQWMYDSFSLAGLLEFCGFNKSVVVSPTKSSIPGWDSFKLDAVDGIPLKPDSLYMEAIKI